MAVYGITDPGLRRSGNQDAFRVLKQGNATVIIVCDGMGGAAAGEVASQVAADAFIEAVSKLLEEAGSFEQILCAGTLSAGTKVLEEALSDPSKYGMGTTLAAAIIGKQGTALIANIGDSRVYMISDKGITRLTDDHSVVADLVRQGFITEADARVHPKRNLITRVIGTEEIPFADLSGAQLSQGTRILACSDGLHGVLEDEEILNISKNCRDVKTLCESLISETYKRGAPDNIAVVVYEHESVLNDSNNGGGRK